MTQSRPHNTEVENENLKPSTDGRPPRPATEPDGAEESVTAPGGENDPGSGEPV
ncbi:MAG: hypothetical protein Q8L66_08480 [Caulobacter sp.]|nr:hypothetical protein [Caulobacter sp.]